MVHGDIDVVEAQLRLQIPGLSPAEGAPSILDGLGNIKTSGHAIEVCALPCLAFLLNLRIQHVWRAAMHQIGK